MATKQIHNILGHEVETLNETGDIIDEVYLGELPNQEVGYDHCYDDLIPVIEVVIKDLREINTQEANKKQWGIKNTMWLFNIGNTFNKVVEAIKYIQDYETNT